MILLRSPQDNVATAMSLQMPFPKLLECWVDCILKLIGIEKELTSRMVCCLTCCPDSDYTVKVGK